MFLNCICQKVNGIYTVSTFCYWLITGIDLSSSPNLLVILSTVAVESVLLDLLLSYLLGS